MKAIVKAARSAVVRKDALPASMGFGSGWRPMGAYLKPGSPAAIAKAINTYGGHMEESSATVFACTTLIAETGAGYEWGITDLDNELLEGPVNEDDVALWALLQEPWPEATYTDFMGDIFTDLCLVGNSIWVKRDMNGFGQPIQLDRMLPSDVKVVEDRNTKQKIGYTVRINGRDVPFDNEDILHYRLRNPLNRHWGMGIVEAIIREVQSDLAQSAHVTAFFTNGARIAGVMTVADRLDEVQFARLKEEIAAEYGSPHDAYKILIAEKTTDFKPISQGPAQTHVVELRNLAKNEILQGFGVPEFLLGGKAEGGIPKMEQAQYVFYRRMLARAQNVQDRTSLSLVSKWQDRKFTIMPELNEPPEQKLKNAELTSKAGGTLNDVRVAAGLAEIDDERADIPLILTTLQPLQNAFQQPAAGGDQTQQPPPGKALGPADVSAIFAGVRAPRRRKSVLRPAPDYRALRAKVQEQPGTTLKATWDVDGDATEIQEEVSLETVMKLLERGSDTEAAKALTERMLGDPGQPPYPAHSGGSMLPVPPTDAGIPLDWQGMKFTFQAPELPPGYEQRAELVDPGEADVVSAQRLLQGQARFFTRVTPLVYSRFVVFFNDQRLRVLRQLHEFSNPKGRSMGSRKGPLEKPDDIWVPDVEREALLAMYLPLVDELGPEAIAVPREIVNATNFSWDLEHEEIRAGREALAEKVVRINETTRRSIAEVVEEGVKRGYSIPRIANGYPDEGYRGIQDVFNEATAVRAETIARSETAMLYNAASVASYRKAGVERVKIFDGTGDDLCASWADRVVSIDEFAANPIGHPNCVRAGAPTEEALT